MKEVDQDQDQVQLQICILHLYLQQIRNVIVNIDRTV